MIPDDNRANNLLQLEVRDFCDSKVSSFYDSTVSLLLYSITFTHLNLHTLKIYLKFGIIQYDLMRMLTFQFEGFV